MRIIHFSDIHVGGLSLSAAGLLDKRLLGSLNYLLRRRRRQRWERIGQAVRRIRELRPDIVVCTGDLTSVGTPAEFEQAVTLLQPLVTDETFDFIYVPGNHDRYVRDQECRRSSDETFRTLNRGRWSVDDLPIAHELLPLTFLLVNQAWPGSWLSSSGRLDAPAVEWLRAFFAARPEDRARRTVLVCHYPLADADGRRLSRRRRCCRNDILERAYATGGIRIGLCGHIHTPFERTAPGRAEYCAGSLTSAGCLNLLDYHPDDERWTQRWVRLDAD